LKNKFKKAAQGHSTLIVESRMLVRNRLSTAILIKGQEAKILDIAGIERE
jgi:hypothetical protein